MNMENLFNKAFAKLKLFKLSGFKSAEYVKFDKIPDVWTPFPNLESDDKWVRVDFPKSEKKTACLYFGKKGSIFPPHKHDLNEKFMIINEGGELEITTSEESKILKFPESYYIPKDMVHSLEFKSDTKLIVIWKGDFKSGWEADVIKL